MDSIVTQERKGYVSAQSVADLAGVSRSAVSRTFTAGASVSDETRRKVLAAADRLGYHVNHLARGLISEQSNIVSLVVSNVSNPYQALIVEELLRVLQATARVAMVINTDGADDGAAEALRQSLNYRADATILLSGRPSSSLIETCRSNGQHVILVNRDERPDGVDRIVLDNATAAAEAVRLNLRAGCRKHVVVSASDRSPSLVARETAYLGEARRLGLEVQVVEVGPMSYATGAESARRVFGRAETPDAAFCVTDLLALGFMDTARAEFGLEIPRDFCVIGFDDIEQAGWMSYELTTFRQPIPEIAQEIVRLLDAPPERDGGRDRTVSAIPIWRRTVRPRAAPRT